MAPDTVRLGVVGLGGMGRRHADNAAAHGHAVVAGADVSADAREAFADAHGARTYADHEAMLDAVDLDAVVVATPNALHAPAVRAALAVDCHVLCEKPLADSLEAAESVAAAAADSEGSVTVGFNKRFHAGTAVAKAYQRAGRLGDVTDVEADFVRRRGLPGRDSWFHSPELAGGGVVLDVGVHVLHLALWLTDFPAVESVSATTRRTYTPRTEYADPDGFAAAWGEGGDDGGGAGGRPADECVEDGATALVRTEGPTITLDLAWASNRPPRERLRLDGTEAGAEFDLDADAMTLYEADTAGVDHYRTSEVTGEYAPGGWERMTTTFCDAVAAGHAPAVNGLEEALAVQRVLDAVYRSAEAGREVTVRDD
ncbi:MAG: Gfo/Idh/MocA family protein [Halobacteriaceae archaeon]